MPFISLSNWGRAARYLFLGYAIATVAGFLAYYISEAVMWTVTFTLMPLVFAGLVFFYLKEEACPPKQTWRETLGLITFWIVASFLLDALVYILFVPLTMKVPPNWTFFLDQSPWIWLNYVMFLLIGGAGRWWYLGWVKSTGNE